MSRFSPAQKRLIAFLLVIASGVVLRGYGRRLSATPFAVKYGGSALWAAIIYLFVALLLRHRSRKTILIVAASICAAIEFGKLLHTPTLDIFRLTTAGAWMLGRVFAWPNFLAYAVGLGAIWLLDGLFVKKLRARRGDKTSAARRSA